MDLGFELRFDRSPVDGFLSHPCSVLVSGFAEIAGSVCSAGIPSAADFADWAQGRETFRACELAESMQTSVTS